MGRSRLWPPLKDSLSCQLRVLCYLGTAWAIQVHLLISALKGPMAVLEALLAQLSALHIRAISYAVRRHFLVNLL